MFTIIMSTGKRSENKINVKMNITVDVTPIAAFKWNEGNAQKLRELRENAGYSRQKLSDEVGVSVAYIQQLETPHVFLKKPKKPDQMTVSTEILEKLCTALKADITSLIWDVDCSS
ncbi:MAG: helix-turn-helix domain-containing protein [Nostoc sp. LLA-1]|nr:helix-turn-helix domain-containing protein [Cyanocohniella sp. LLY]